MVSIWDAAVEELRSSENSEKLTDKYVLFTGASESGKTSAILKFLSRDEPTRPTIALEYTFARKTSNMSKMTGHIWELGGGSHMTKLIQVPINADTLQQLTIVIVADLSAPKKLWTTVDGLISTTRQQCDHVIKQASKRDPTFHKTLKKATKHRLGMEKEKMESNEIKPFPIPLVIIGTKYDVFQDMDFEERKLISGALRCLAHCNGATLLFTSTKIDATSKVLRHVVNVAAFDGKLNKTSTLEDGKPVYVAAGTDSVEDIGLPPKSLTSVRGDNKSLFDVWKSVFCSHFQQEGGGEFSNIEPAVSVEDPARDKQFAEPKIDDARVEKDRVLEAYRKEELKKWTSKIN